MSHPVHGGIDRSGPRPHVPNRLLDRRTLLRVAGLSVLGVALGGCRGSEIDDAPCAVDADDELRTIVRDAFDRPDGPIGLTETGEAWEEQVGMWSVVSGHARAVPEFAAQVCTALVETGSADGRLDVVLTLSPTPRRANAGVVFRGVDDGMNLFVKLERSPVNPEGMFAIGKRQGGRVTYLATRTSGIVFDNGDTVRLVVDLAGPEIRARVSTCETLEHTLAADDLAAFGGLTRHGLRVNAAPDDDDGGSSFDEVAFSAAG